MSSLNYDIKIDFPVDYANRYHIFYDLMQFNIKDVLLVSSLYDDFILEEDGRLSEDIYSVYSKLNLSIPPPRIIRVATGREAIEAMKKKQFDLVITMRRLGDFELKSFGKKVKEISPSTPIILLLTAYSEITNLPPRSEIPYFDRIFVYNGDTELFLAIIKLIEDEKNVAHDTKVGNVRVIIVIEDTIQYFSIFLPLIYKELLTQTQISTEEGMNLSHRFLKRRGRPKILLAETYEEAIFFYESYKSYLLGVISDIAYPRNGIKDFDAGFDIVRYMRTENRFLPALLQSSDPKNKERAKFLGVDFVHKNSPNYLRKLRKFFQESMLFGDFVFRDENGKEIARAKNMNHFEKILPSLPGWVIELHGSQNHFSNWLFARGEHQLAEKLAPYSVNEFKDAEEIRSFLLQTFQRRRRENQRGIITEFSKEIFDTSPPFIRIGTGSLGGKGRGLAFINAILIREEMNKLYDNIELSIPDTIVICTDLFDKFIEENDLFDLCFSNDIDEDVLRNTFLSKSLPSQLSKDLKYILHKWKEPIAVRSSSILEDSHYQPFAGIYKTFMLSNDQKNFKTRLKYVEDAIKLVYASIYSKLAKSYINSLGQKIEIEKMAIIIQKIVGKIHEDRYYPSFSGVAKSFNYYPVSYQKSDDGICHIAIGLGEQIVSGSKSLGFSPKYPKMLPQVSTPEYALKNTQVDFYALKLKEENIDLKKGETTTLKKYETSIAKNDNVLNWLASVYDSQNNRIVDNFRLKGPILITFPFILKYSKFPLSEIVTTLLDTGEEGFGFPVEIEFAINLDVETNKHQFKILQIRPLVISQEEIDANLDLNEEEKFVYCSNALGNGIYDKISDIIIVNTKTFDKTKTLEIKDEINYFNNKLSADGKEYILIGPGRWGTKERFLGIPVVWNDINYAQVIIEIGLENYEVDPSQGMHFFVNLTTTKKGYFSIPYDSKENKIDWEWLETQKLIEESKFVKHFETYKPIKTIIDGKNNIGIITK